MELSRSLNGFGWTLTFELAHGFYEGGGGNARFLGAGRQTDGTRTFKLVEGEPLPSSFGEDLYQDIFVDKAGHGATDAATALASAR